MGPIGASSAFLRGELENLLPLEIGSLDGRLFLAVTAVPSFNAETISRFRNRKVDPSLILLLIHIYSNYI